MKKIVGLGAVLLAGFLAIPGNLGFAGQALAQGGAQTGEDEQLQDLRQKRQETLPEQEREAQEEQNVGQRNQDAIQRQQDAIQRQKAADPQQQDLDEEEK
jgi:hypothetical protein